MKSLRVDVQKLILSFLLRYYVKCKHDALLRLLLLKGDIFRPHVGNFIMIKNIFDCLEFLMSVTVAWLRFFFWVFLFFFCRHPPLRQFNFKFILLISFKLLLLITRFWYHLRRFFHLAWTQIIVWLFISEHVSKLICTFFVIFCQT